jgi:hypothetical protein
VLHCCMDRAACRGYLGQPGSRRNMGDAKRHWRLSRFPRNCQAAFGHSQRSRRTKRRSRPDSGAPTSCIAPPVARDPRSMATNPTLLINSITSCFASVKSCIQAIGMLLIDFTSLAPTAISATISLDVRPLNAARDLVTPARLVSGLGSICALLASIRIRPHQRRAPKTAASCCRSTYIVLCVLIMFVAFPRPRSSTGRLVRVGDPAFVFFHGRLKLC